MNGATPERTCCACKRKGPQTSFLRVKRTPAGNLTLDAKAQGRSAYCCDDPDCKSALLDKDRLSRAFKARVDEDARLGLAQELECRQR